MALIDYKYIERQPYDINYKVEFDKLYQGCDLRKNPETFLTILKDEYGNNSQTNKLRRKINNLKKFKIVYDEIIPSVNGREKIFFCFNKDYNILITRDDVYYSNNIVFGSKKILLKECYKLDYNFWKYYKEIELSNEEIKKCL